MIVGLTGGIGSGKSTAAKIFNSLGITTIDADHVAREVVEPGTPALTQIEQHFGSDILAQSHLNRSKLRELIFKNPSEKEWLETLLHPIIREEMLTQVSNSQSIYTILEAPLLFENNLNSLCDRTVLIDIEETRQIERASKRDGDSADSIKKIIDSQMPRNKKKLKADYILNNAEGISELEIQILRLDQILKLIATNTDFL